jgi:hypothetical protein
MTDEETRCVSFPRRCGGLVDEANAGGSTTLQGGVEVVDGEADVMDSGAPFGHEPADR